MNYTVRDVELLRERVGARLSEKRFKHTLGVEKAAFLLAKSCLPDDLHSLCAAALLHDIAKEYTDDEIISFIEADGIILGDDELSSPAVLHSFAAPFIIKRDFSEFCDEKILSACKNHTLGSPDMSIFDEIIFIADYIEDGRSYESCIKVREALYSSLTDDRIQNIKELHKAVISSIDYTKSSLEISGKHINSKMLLTRNTIMSKI